MERKKLTESIDVNKFLQSLSDQELEAYCNFNVEHIDDEICYLSWDATEIMNPTCSRYEITIKMMYDDYLYNINYKNSLKAYALLHPHVENVSFGKGSVTVFNSDLDDIIFNIREIVRCFVCSEDALKQYVSPLIKEEKSILPLSKIELLGTTMYHAKNGIEVLKDSYETVLSICNNKYAIVTYDFSNLERLKRRFKHIELRINDIYHSYKQSKDFHYIATDKHTFFYIYIEDIVVFIKAIDRIIQDEIRMEYY